MRTKRNFLARFLRRRGAVLAACVGSLAACRGVYAATIYSNDFSGTASGGYSNSYADLTTFTAGVATFPSSDTGSYTIVGSSSAAYASRSIALLTPTANTTFTESATVDITSASVTPSAGLRILATDTNDDKSAYWADIAVTAGTNTIAVARIYGENSSGGTTDLVTNLSIPNFAMDTVYDLTVTGTYDAFGDLTLSLVVTQDDDSANSVTVTTASLSSPYAGTYFGFRQSAGSASPISATYDNLLVTDVPEPASLSALGLWAAGLLVRRRRRR